MTEYNCVFLLRSHNCLDAVTSPEQNALDAAGSGMATVLTLAPNVAANLVAFISMVAFVDFLFSHLGALVGWQGLSLKASSAVAFLFLSYLRNYATEPKTNISNSLEMWHVAPKKPLPQTISR